MTVIFFSALVVFYIMGKYFGSVYFQRTGSSVHENECGKVLLLIVEMKMMRVFFVKNEILTLTKQIKIKIVEFS